MTPDANKVQWGNVAAFSLGLLIVAVLLVLLIRIERELRIARRERNTRPK